MSDDELVCKANLSPSDKFHLQRLKVLARVSNNMLLFRPNILVNLNEIAGERGLLTLGSEQKLAVVVSSFLYYSEPEKMIASVFRAIVCSHLFVNGNKRTAILWLLAFASLSKIEISLSEQELYDLVLSVAESGNSMSVEEIAIRIFPEIKCHMHASPN